MDDLLIKYLEKIRKHFDIEKLVRENQDLRKIKNYYKYSKLGYLLFHSQEGFMHFGLTKDNSYKKEDLKGQLEYISSYINKFKFKKVLEVGSGHGANCYFLALKHPNTQFVAVDLVNKPFKKYQQLTNVIYLNGDYHNLDNLPDNEYDIVFAIDTLCYSRNDNQVLGGLAKKLKSGGLLVIFDGFYSNSFSKLTKAEKIAAKLLERGMALNRFRAISEYRHKLKKRFSIFLEEDLSLFAIPSTKKQQRFARVFFKFPILTTIFKKALPGSFIKNTIAGLLLAYSLETKIASYYLFVAKKH